MFEKYYKPFLSMFYHPTPGLARDFPADGCLSWAGYRPILKGGSRSP
jgi:hypothetical protein